MHDVLGRIARPGNIGLDRALRVHQGHSNRMDTGNKGPVRPQLVQDRATHSGHDPHVNDDVGRIRQLNANLRDRAAKRSH